MELETDVFEWPALCEAIAYFRSPPADCVGLCMPILRAINTHFGDYDIEEDIWAREPSGWHDRISKKACQLKDVIASPPAGAGLSGINFFHHCDMPADITNCLWDLSYRDSDTHADMRYGPVLHLTAQSSLFTDSYEWPHPPKQFLDVLTTFFEAADATGCATSGFVDCDHPRNLMWGTYNSVIQMYKDDVPPWRYELERYSWLTLGPQERYRRVRGPFWGTYLSAELFERLNDDGRFVERYMSVGTSEDSTKCVRELSNGGRLIQLSHDPLDMQIIPGATWPAVIENAVWLKRELARTGLLAE